MNRIKKKVTLESLQKEIRSLKRVIKNKNYSCGSCDYELQRARDRREMSSEGFWSTYRATDRYRY